MRMELCLNEFEAALFDVDGTLIDSLGTIVHGLGDAFEKYAGVRPPDEELRGLVGLPLSRQLRLYTKTEPTQEMVQEMISYAVDRFEEYKHMEEPIPEAVETLRLFQEAGMKTGLVTSKTRRELESFQERFNSVISVDVTVCASDVSRPKPDPESLYLACERLNVRPKAALMIGDSVYDLRTASSAGAASIGVSYGSSTRQALEAEQPSAIFESAQEMLDWARASLLESTCQERKKKN